MGLAKSKRPTFSPGNRAKQTIVTSTATVLPREGNALVISSTDADRIFRLPAPVRGAELSVFVKANASTDVVTVRTLTTAVTFMGSTRQSVVFTTGVAVDRAVTLVGLTSAAGATPKWAVRSVSGGTIT